MMKTKRDQKPALGSQLLTELEMKMVIGGIDDLPPDDDPVSPIDPNDPTFAYPIIKYPPK